MSIRIVGVALVHNEDVFVERAIRNVADFCDRIHVADAIERLSERGNESLSEDRSPKDPYG